MKLKRRVNKALQAGFTLLELLVGLGITSLVILAAFTIFSTGVEMSSFFHRAASTTEYMSEGLQTLTTIIPQVTRIRTCNCSGTTATANDCYLDPANPWTTTPPASFDATGDSSAATTRVLFDADFESFYGGTGDTFALASVATDPLLTSNITGAACETNSTAFGTNTKGRGCKRRVRLLYFFPQAVSGSTPSKPGQLSIRVSSTTAPALTPETTIGSVSGKQGLVALTCGLLRPVANQVGTIFGINLRFKVKASSNENIASSGYESWTTTGTGNGNYGKGSFREVQLKLALGNVSNRGAYQWRMQSYKGCWAAGTTIPALLNPTKEMCCSGAIDASNVCLAACVSGGGTIAAAADSMCCSEARTSGGNCI